jgi:hypothetical protein
MAVERVQHKYSMLHNVRPISLLFSLPILLLALTLQQDILFYNRMPEFMPPSSAAQCTQSQGCHTRCAPAHSPPPSCARPDDTVQREDMQRPWHFLSAWQLKEADSSRKTALGLGILVECMRLCFAQATASVIYVVMLLNGMCTIVIDDDKHELKTRAARRRRTYGYGTAVIWYGYRTIGTFSGHLTVWLQYGIVPY